MANIDERYKRGKIYTIRCRYDDNLIYVGSTIDKLAKRFSGHSRDKKCSLYKYVEGNWTDWYIELYEDYPCDNKEQLHKREGEVIREIATINNRIAGRSKRERYKDNRDEILEYQKQYRQDNRDDIAEKKKQYHQDNRDKHLEQYKQHYQDNRDKRLDKAKKYREDNSYKIKCDLCCAEIKKINLNRHQKTAKCMNYNLNNN